MGSITSFFDSNFAGCFSIYFVLMISIVVVTTFLEKICIVFKNKAHLSDGVVAGIVLGVITSIPELITCITSIVKNKSGAMGVGDIIGSNIFDLFVLAVCLLICVWLFIKNKADSINLYSLICAGIGTIFVFFGMLTTDQGPIFKTIGSSPLVWHGFNFFSIPVFLSYALAIFFIFRDNKKQRVKKDDDKSITEDNNQKGLYKIKTPLLALLIVAVAIVLILVSVFLTYASSSLIKKHFHMGESFGGAILLGIVTSLPEIVCCINLCRQKEYNMLINTMVGSCTFNLSILTIANIALSIVFDPSISDCSMYAWTKGNILQIIVCMVIVCLCIAYLIFNNKKFKTILSPKSSLALNCVLLSLVIISFIVFIVLGSLYQDDKSSTNLIAQNLSLL